MKLYVYYLLIIIDIVRRKGCFETLLKSDAKCLVNHQKLYLNTPIYYHTKNRIIYWKSHQKQSKIMYNTNGVEYVHDISKKVYSLDKPLAS